MRSRGRRRRQEPRLEPYSLSAVDAARYLGISVVELRRRARQGEVRVARLGRKLVFRRRDLEEFIDRLIREPEPDPLEGLAPAGRREGER